MMLVKVTCEVRYLERIKLLSGYEAIYKDMLKKEPEEAKSWIVPGMRLQDKDRKRVLLVDPVRSVIDIEQPPNLGFSKDSIMQFFKSVNERIGIPQVARYGLRSTWIEEYKGSFQELLDHCKERIFGNSKLVEKVNDVGAVFDYITGAQRLSVTVGPMELEQLRTQFLVFEPTSLPSLFTYVDVDMGDSATKDFSAQYLASFVDKGIKEGERLSLEVISHLGVGT